MNSKAARTASPQRNRTGCEATASLAAEKWATKQECPDIECLTKAVLAGVAWQQKQKVKVNV